MKLTVFESQNLLNKAFQKLFLKKRFIFRSTENQDLQFVNLDTRYMLIQFNSPKDDSFLDKGALLGEYLKKRYGDQGADKRLSDPYWNAYVVIDTQVQKVAGVAWLIKPLSNFWYDNVKFPSDECHLANDYVEEEYRGNRIGSFLNSIRYQHVLNDEHYKCASAIVESYRAIAVKNQLKFSPIYSVNYLIKLFGFNFFSLTVNGGYNLSYVGPFTSKKWKVISNK